MIASFHVIPKLWITGFDSLLLQFLQRFDAPLQSLRDLLIVFSSGPNPSTDK